MSGEAMSAAALSYARGRPNAAAANSALARLVFATPTSSKESDKARKAGTWAVVAQPRLALSPTIPTRNRLSINFSVTAKREWPTLQWRPSHAARDTGRGSSACCSPFASPRSGDDVVLVRRIGPVAPSELRIAERRRAGGDRIDPLRIEHDHSVSNTPFAIALLQPVGITYVHHPICCGRIANALRPVKRPAIMLSEGHIAIHLDVLIAGEVHRGFEGGQQFRRPFDKTFDTTLIGAVPIDGIRVIAGPHESPVHTVDAPAIPDVNLADFRLVHKILKFWIHFTSPGFIGKRPAYRAL